MAVLEANRVADPSGATLTVPPGTLIFHCANSAPSGFIKANGAAVSRTTYAALFSAIGTTFGAGDGSTTFTLPDMRGEFPRGWDDARGIDSGRAFGGAQSDAFQGHRHSANGPSGTTGDPFNVPLQGTNRQADQNYTDYAFNMRADATNGTPRTAAETRPRNIALLACIKF
jgi:phage-related tail fiber protein